MVEMVVASDLLQSSKILLVPGNYPLKGNRFWRNCLKILEEYSSNPPTKSYFLYQWFDDVVAHVQVSTYGMLIESPRYFVHK